MPAIDSFLLNKEIYEVSDSRYKETVDELSELLDVKDLIKIPVRNLSLGQRMKMELIASLIHKPQVLFLDEPTIGLDVVMQKKMREFIAEYNKIYKSTILLTSHYMADVKQLCKRVIIIDHGKLIYDGDLAKLVDKYANTKWVTVDFIKDADRGKLEKLGFMKSFEPHRVVFNVKKEEALILVATLLKEFEIEDLNIEDPDIEEIIRIVFAAGRNV